MWEAGGDEPAAQHDVAMIEYGRLPRRDGGDRAHKSHLDFAVPDPDDFGGHDRRAVTDPDANGVARRRRGPQPVDRVRRQSVAEEFVSGADRHGAFGRPDRNHEHRLAETARKPTALANRVVRESMVLTEDGAVRQDERSRREGRPRHRELAPEDRHVVAVRDKADLLTLRLVGDPGEPEGTRDGARLLLGLGANRQEQARYHGGINTPQEVGLVLRGVYAAEQPAIRGTRVVAGRNEWRVNRIGLGHEVAELRKGVAAHARNGCAPGRVLGDEVRNDV